MLPIKKIICPTDFSDPSYVAIKTAGELARHFSAELILVHIIAPLPSYASAGITPGTSSTPQFDLATYNRQLEIFAQESFKEIIEKRLPSDLRVRTSILQGQAADEIVKAVSDEKADMIIISTHGRTGWRRFIFGSVAEKVIRTTTCPVLTIHKPNEE